MLDPLAFVQISQYIKFYLYCTPAKCTAKCTAQSFCPLELKGAKLTNNKGKCHTRTPTHGLPCALAWSWDFNKGALCIRLGSKGQTTVALLVLFLPVGYAMLMRPNKAEIAAHGFHCPDDMAVLVPERGLVFECVTCFNCLKGVSFVVDCVKYVSIRDHKKKDDPPLRDR